jgi:quercetin dioxygenase-like cupin family protein
MYFKPCMRRLYFSAVLLLVFLVSWPLNGVCEQAHDNTAAVVTNSQWRMTTADKIEWLPSKLLPPGARMAVLEGDPSKPEFFIMRLKMPDGYRIPAHSHSQPERVTVLAGTLYLGMGDGSDARAAIPLGPGSYSSMPPKMVHFGWMKGETILQLTSIGPWTVTYVNPNDDPRKPSQ